MRVLAPAKINLHLRVGPVRTDGFHPLLTWMCTVGLFDILDIRRAGGEGTTLTIETTDVSDMEASVAGVRPPVTSEASPERAAGVGSTSPWDDSEGKSADVPTDGTNLVVRAASSWVTTQAGIGEGSPTTTPLPGRGFSISLRKRIPVGAGLGGGSSDAARTLIVLNRLDRAELSPARLAEFALQLGSDVPFFVHGPSSICKGRGENVTPTPMPTKAKWAVLFLPGFVLPTAQVYQRFDAMKLGRSQDVDNEPDWSQWATLPASQLMPLLVNDLELPSFNLRPALSELREMLTRATGQVVRMSGSGSSLFTLADDEVGANAIASKARRVWSGRIEVVRLCPTLD